MAHTISNTMLQRTSATRPSQQGFNLVEVMIALVVLAVGLLGLAGLQNFSLKTTHQSYQRTQATILIHEIIDRMRANAGTAPLWSNLANYIVATPTDNIAGPDCTISACTPANLALHDLREWTAAMRSTSGLGPSGRAQVTQVASFASGVLATVSLTWVESYGEDAAGVENRVEMNQTMTVHLP